MIDLHAHPSLKTYLFGKKLYRRYRAGGAWNPLVMRVDLPKMREGGVNAVFASHYLPEQRMIRDCPLMKFLSGLLGAKFRGMRDGSPFEQTNRLVDTFEQAVEKAQQNGWPEVGIARSLTELDTMLSEDKTVLMHSIEGAHSLEDRIENLQHFFDRGVNLITLAHFYQNETTHTVGGIPGDKKMLGCFKKSVEQTAGLTDFGKQVVEEMLRLGMVVDLSHCTPATREEVYRINHNRRPLVFSHVGVREQNDATMNPTDEEIKIIAGSGGVVGVIFMNFWLAKTHAKNGLDLLVNTIRHLKNTGGIDCVAFGSDFDGFTDPPDDIKDMSQMSRLTDALLQAGFNEPEVEKIMGANILRMIHDGWGKN